MPCSITFSRASLWIYKLSSCNFNFAIFSASSAVEVSGEAVSAFASGDYDILVGTQMVAKGLDFPKVTLVGVLSADRSLYSADYRSFERTFSLLTQVVGRSGRGSEAGWRSGVYRR